MDLFSRAPSSKQRKGQWEAQRVARIELGGIEQVKEQVREVRVGNWLRSVISDCRYGVRQLRKNPGFTVVAVLTLALGIAVNATMFSLVSAFLLRRPPGCEPERVTFRIKGQPELPANQLLSGLDVVVTSGYFGAAGIPLLRGRTFTETDSVTAPRVVLVNQEFVHRALQDQEPLGKEIQLDVSGATPGWSEIVGVVGNVKTPKALATSRKSTSLSYSGR